MRPPLCLAVAWGVWGAWTINLTLNRSDEGPGFLPGLFLVPQSVGADGTKFHSCGIRLFHAIGTNCPSDGQRAGTLLDDYRSDLRLLGR
jgi:hypothetical protein